MRRKNLSQDLKLRARYKAEVWIAELYTEPEVRKKLQDQFKCSPETARKIYRAAVSLMVQEDQNQKPERTAIMLRAMGRLYRKCWDKQRYQTCATVLREIKRMQGLDAPLKLASLPTPQEQEDRTERELQYYLDHGHWPEEAPRAPATASGLPDRSDPLQKLH